MLSREWALVGFTLLSQLAIGSFWMIWFTRWVSRQRASEAEAKNLTAGALWAVGPVMALGLLLSLFHLGYPLNAWRSISNLGSSWLSREVFFALGFFVMWAVGVVAEWRGLGTGGQRAGWALLTSLVGLATVISTAMAYMVPTRPAWFDLATPLFFFASALLLGGLGVGALYGVYYLRAGKESESQAVLVKTGLRHITLMAMVVIVIQAITLIFQATYLTGGTVESRASAQLLLGTFGAWYWIRVVVGIVAGFFLVWLGWRTVVKADRLMPAQTPNLMLAAFACVLVGEVIGRALFYFTVVPVKLPGVL